MSKNHIVRLKKIQEKLAQFQNDIQEIIIELEEESNSTKVPKVDFDSELLIEKLKISNRDEAKILLEGLKQKELGVLFIKLGGASRDSKKKKDWLIERILWLLFDFKEGHNLLRN